MQHRAAGSHAPPTAEPHPLSAWLALGGLFLAVLLVYLPAIRGDFLWDDDKHLTQNTLLRSWAGLRALWLNPTALHVYYPLTFTTFSLQYRLWGLNPLGYHLVNVLLHALNAALLGVVLRRLRVPGAWFAAAVFAVHPVCVMSVAWITELKNVQSFAFYACAMLACLAFERAARRHSPNGTAEKHTEIRPGRSRPRQRPQDPGLPSDGGPASVPAVGAVERLNGQGRAHPRRRLYALALLLFLGAMLSKTVTCTFPVSMFLLLWWQQRREQTAAANAETGRRTDGHQIRNRMRLHAVRLLPFLGLAVAVGLVTVHVETVSAGARGPDWAFTPLERGLNAGRIFWSYVLRLAWPVRLSFLYPKWVPDAGNWRQYLFPASAAALPAALWLLRRRIGLAPFVAVLFYGITLGPVLGFLNVFMMRYTFVADHWQYHACPGLIALFAAGLWRPRGTQPPKNSPGGPLARLRGNPLRGALSAGILTALAALAWRQAHIYRDAETLWRDTVAKTPSSSMAHYNLANLLAAGGRLEAAVRHYSEALRLQPDTVDARSNLATILARQGQIEAARDHFAELVRRNPDSGAIHINIGTLYAHTRRFREAAVHFSEALRREPDSDAAHYNMGSCLAELGKTEEAAAHYSTALRLNPRHARAHFALGALHESLRRPAEALHHYRAAARLEPDWAEALRRTAWLLATVPALAGSRPDEAVEFARRAALLSPNGPAFDTLAAACAAAGRYEEAGQCAEKAAALYSAGGQPDLARDAETRRVQYKKAAAPARGSP
ncbi:MAG: tetratricopeptide repeat protein [Kiritimatiellae bacterium]|nr:tetratricopeptide repeat protein [Kiritimatiellia bacterium]